MSQSAPDELITLAEAGAQAFVTAMASDAWPAVKGRFAHLLRTEQSALDGSRQRYAQHSEQERAKVLAGYRTDAAARLVELMRQDPAIVSEVRGLLGELAASESAGSMNAAVHQQITGSTVTNAVTMGSNTGEVNVGAKIGKLENRFSLGGPLLLLAELIRSYPRITAGIATLIITGAGGGLIAASGSGRGGPGQQHVVLSSSASSGALPGVSAAASGASQLNPDNPAGTLQAVICPTDKAEWDTVDVPGKGMQTPKPLITLPESGACPRPFDLPFLHNVLLYQVSRSLESWGDTQQTVNGSWHVGYVPTNTPSGAPFTDVSGANDSNFAATWVSDNQMMFNPATGDEWWERNGQMFSNTVPPTKAVDHGPGDVYTFTSTGEPMPLPFLDSPSGAMRVTFSDAIEGQLAIGPASVLNSSCLQNAKPSASDSNFLDIAASCPGAAVSQQPPCTSDTDIDLAGFIDDSTLACWTASTGGTVFQALTVSTSGGLHVTATRPLTPATQQGIDGAFVTPDGRNLVFLTNDGEGEHVYSTTTSGDGAATPTLLAQWSDTPAVFIGWRLPNGTLVP